MDPSNAMNTGDWISAGQNIVQGGAILIGGAWAYFKFVKGRTFHRRAELGLEASLLSDGRCVRAKASMRNTGAASIPLRLKIVKVETLDPEDLDDKGSPAWRELVKPRRVFEDHDWIESQETIGDDLVTPIPAFPPKAIAVCVTCVVYEKRRERWYKRKRQSSTPAVPEEEKSPADRTKKQERGSSAWTAKSIIPLGEQQKALPRGGIEVTEKRREYQREEDEQQIRRIEQEQEHLERQREAPEEEIQQAERETKDD